VRAVHVSLKGNKYPSPGREKFSAQPFTHSFASLRSEGNNSLGVAVEMIMAGNQPPLRRRVLFESAHSSSIKRLQLYICMPVMAARLEQ
jgi:hypothetical protein